MKHEFLLWWGDNEAANSRELLPVLAGVKVAPPWRATDASLRILYSACAQDGHDVEPCSHTEDEHDLMFLGGRILTNTLAAVRLLCGGYYGPPIALTRDSVEATMLLALFEAVPTDLQEWRRLDRRDRWRRFSPNAVQDKLTALGVRHRYEEYDL